MMNEFDESPEDKTCDISPVSDILSNRNNFDVLNDLIFLLVELVFIRTNTDKKLVELFINPTVNVEYGDVVITHTIRNNTKDEGLILKKAKEISKKSNNDNEHIISLGMNYYEEDENSSHTNFGEWFCDVKNRHVFTIAAKDGSFTFDFDLFYFELQLFEDKTIFSNINRKIRNGRRQKCKPKSMKVHLGYKLLPIDFFYYETYGCENYEPAIAWLNKMIKNIESHEVYCKLDDTYISEFNFDERARNIPLVALW